MVVRQVLFRIDQSLLKKLDRQIARDGYTTRNAWFEQMVRDYADRDRRK